MKKNGLVTFLTLGISIAYLIFFTLKTQHTAWTEMLVYPFLLNNGFTLYNDLIAPYTPIFLWFLQFFTLIFGYQPQVSLYLSLLVGVINTFVIYAIVSKLTKEQFAASFSVFFYVLWFFYFEGNGLWFELFQTPIILGSFYFFYLYMFIDKKINNLWTASILLSLAFFMKQSVFWIYFSLIGYITFSAKFDIKGILKQIIPIISALMFVFIILTFITLTQKNFQEFFQWTFIYTFFFFPFSSGHSEYPNLSQVLKLIIPNVILLPGLFYVFKAKKEAIFSIIFIMGASMAVLPRWSLFHLQPSLALTSVAGAIFGYQIIKQYTLLKKWHLPLLLILTLTHSIVVGRQLGRFYEKPIRFFEPELLQIAEEIKKEGIRNFFVFNSQDQLYILTNTVPNIKPYAQNFTWYMEVPGLQDRILNQIIIKNPKYIVFTPSVKDENKIEKYIMNNYKIKRQLSETIFLLEKRII